jgi:hypothetical protein
MARRAEAPDSLDHFPTPPWATRALIAADLVPSHFARTVWEPAAGSGHMAEVLRESFSVVHATDVHDYGVGYPVGDFVAGGDLQLGDRATCPFKPGWIITNPPFNLAGAFLERALIEAEFGVALLLRTAWMEGAERWLTVFKSRSPTFVAQFVERVAMVKGRWDPSASSATAYAWFVWHVDRMGTNESRLVWIPPGAQLRHSRPDDVKRFGTVSP